MGFNMRVLVWSALLIHMQDTSIKYYTFPFILHWSIIQHNFWRWKQGRKKSYFQVALLFQKSINDILSQCFSLILILLTVYTFAKYTAHQWYTNGGPLLRASNQKKEKKKKKKYNRKEIYRLENSYFRMLCHFRVPPMLVRKVMHNVSNVVISPWEKCLRASHEQKKVQVRKKAAFTSYLLGLSMSSMVANSFCLAFLLM